MAFGSSLSGLMVAIVATSITFTAAAATSHTVGDSFGWTVPQSNPSVYKDWSTSNPFAVGDALVFNFPTTRHTVIRVTKPGYDSCNTTDKIGNVLTTGPATFNLNASGQYYFICGEPGHCPAGQKLSITVGSAPAPAPAPGSGGLSPPGVPTPSATPGPPTTGEPTPSATPGPPTTGEPTPSATDSGKSAAAGFRTAAGFSMAVVVASAASAFIF